MVSKDYGQRGLIGIVVLGSTSAIANLLPMLFQIAPP